MLMVSDSFGSVYWLNRTEVTAISSCPCISRSAPTAFESISVVKHRVGDSCPTIVAVQATIMLAVDDRPKLSEASMLWTSFLYFTASSVFSM